MLPYALVDAITFNLDSQVRWDLHNIKRKPPGLNAERLVMIRLMTTRNQKRLRRRPISRHAPAMSGQQFFPAKPAAPSMIASL
jgi:hypothetical protein